MTKRKHLSGLLAAAVLMGLAAAPLSAQPDGEIQKYIDIIRERINEDYEGMFKPAKGTLEHPYIAPGSAQYLEDLWDWDSWLANVALRQILLESGSEKASEEALKHEQGCVLNFLDRGSWDGWIPIRLTPTTSQPETIFGDTDLFSNNMHKPVLAQHAAFLTKLQGGNAEWLREKFYPLQAFVNCYYNHYRNRETGLYYWQTDEAIGVDNDPSTFYRPDASSGSILLNCFMYRELLAMVYLAGQLNMQEIGDHFQAASRRVAGRDPRALLGPEGWFLLQRRFQPAAHRATRTGDATARRRAARLSLPDSAARLLVELPGAVGRGSPRPSRRNGSSRRTIATSGRSMLPTACARCRSWRRCTT